MAHDVFVSHSVKDKAVAEAIVARLVSRVGDLLDSAA